MLAKLHVFKEVYEQNSFSMAAKNLYITQSAVSKIIKSLEEEVRTTLFDRNGVHGVLPTKQADVLYKKTLKLIDEWEYTIDLMHDVEATIKECRIGFSQTVGDTYFALIAAKLIKQYPEINFRFLITNSDEIIANLLSNDIDLGYLEKPIDSKDLEKEEVFVDPMVLVTNPNSNVWLNRERESGVRFYNDLYLFNNPNPYQQIYINSSHLITQIIEHGVGNTIMSIKNITPTMNYQILDESFNRKIFSAHNQNIHPIHQQILNSLNQLFRSI